MMKNFYEKVYDIVAQIPKWTVTTYGCIAMRLGNIRLSRLVGNALHANIDPVNIPCHRVVNREGKLAPMYVFGGIDAQKERLENEGVTVGKAIIMIAEAHCRIIHRSAILRILRI